MLELPRRDRPRSRMIVCGDNPLAHRLAVALSDQPGVKVTVVLPDRKRNHGPQIAAVPGVRVVEAPLPDAEALASAGAAEAVALAAVEQDDVANIHTALRAQEINPNLRLVLRFFNMSLGHRIRELFPDSVVLSDSSTAAPLFVSAALDKVPASYARLPGRDHPTVYLTRREDVPANRVVVGVADTSAPPDRQRLPRDESDADLVLALATGPIPTDGHSAGPVWRVRTRVDTALRTAWARVRALVGGGLSVAALGLLALLVLGVVLLKLAHPNCGTSAATMDCGWWDTAYLIVLDAAGAAQPDLTLSAFQKIVQAVVTVAGITFIPLVTAAVVDGVVKARMGRPPPLRGHVVIAGLGNVGSRVAAQLRQLGVPVIGVEHDPNARGVLSMRRLGVPVVIGDASHEGILREARLNRCRALVAVTNNDVTNLEAALHGRALRPDLRVVLRLFDDDLAERVQRSFQLTTSSSVSFLAAPAFTAAMLGRRILATIPIERQVLVVAELPVTVNAALVGLPVHAASVPELSRVIALHRQGQENLDLPAPPDHPLAVGDRLIIVATRSGLTRLISWSNPASGKPG